MFSEFDECEGKECGYPCTQISGYPGICTGRLEANYFLEASGRCADPIENPCAVHGCDEKKCGEECLQGDIIGRCDLGGECVFDHRPLNCGKKQMRFIVLLKNIKVGLYVLIDLSKCC